MTVSEDIKQMLRPDEKRAMVIAWGRLSRESESERYDTGKIKIIEYDYSSNLNSWN